MASWRCSRSATCRATSTVRPRTLDLDRFTQPGLGWALFPWALPDDQSYRDYLRSVFVLFAHQQKLGVGANPGTFPDIVERQLKARFFQDFRTEDRTEVPLNRMLVPLVTAILTASTGSGFGFGLTAAALPAQGQLTDRQHLDALLALAPVTVEELSNRYRLPLGESDTVQSTPVKLNVHTLSRVLSDTAQGPVEPPENVIEPQLPGEEGRPILWSEVVGSAPFFLRFDEWLARQQPFFAENLFALRTQVVGVARGRLWLNDDRKKFLEYHQGLPGTHPMGSYNGHFATMDEVHRSARFLLKYGEADTKLVELVQAIDRGQFATAARLHEEAEQLLRDATPDPKGTENWEPELSVGTSARPLSLAKRRKLKVSSITELTGTRTTYLPDGFERYFELDTPGAAFKGVIEYWQDVFLFHIARDQATRLHKYQQRFLLPMLEATIRSGLGDLPGAVDLLGGVTGFHVGVGMVGTPAGMVKHPDAIVATFRVVAGRLRWDDPLGDRPYTARLMYDDERRLDGPFPLTPQLRNGHDALTPDEPAILHPLEERYARLVQADALLAWAETLYRTDDAANLERARELYKAVMFLHGEDPGTSAYQPDDFLPQFPWFGLVENPRRRNQLDRARLALHQLSAGLNFYGYNDEAVPTLRYETLVGAAQRWTTGAKSAQSDYLAYLGKVEQSDLDLLTAKAQERKARITVSIAAEQVEIANAGVVVAQKLVTDVEKLITAKQQEIEDANSIFNQFKDYFSGMKSSVSSLVDVGKSASEGYASLSSSSAGSALGLGEGGGAGAGSAGSGSVGLGSAAGGLAVVGGFAAFAVLSTTTLQGMADAATKRDGELKALKDQALPAAKAAVRVQERYVAIARLQGEIAATDLAYARDLVNFQNERFLNRDFWDAIAGVARRALHRYLDLAGQSAWFAERALAYQIATPVRVIRLDYFDLRMRDVGGADRLGLDLAELEAIRLGAARITVPITRTYSLARDLPLAFGQLKRTGRCTFGLNDDDLLTGHPGTFAHRIRSVDVTVDAPGTAVATWGILTNGGFSLLRTAPDAAPVPLVRFADAYPISQHRVGGAYAGQPGEQLLPFEGSGFTTTWSLRLPKGANAATLDRVTDVRLTFELRAAYDAQRSGAAAPTGSTSRSMFVSALAADAKGLATLRKPAATTAKLTFDLPSLAVPHDCTISNIALVLPGVEGGNMSAKLRLGDDAPTSFPINDGIAMSNAGVLGNGAIPQPLNAALGGSPRREVSVEITKGNDAGRLAKARDVLLWVEYDVP